MEKIGPPLAIWDSGRKLITLQSYSADGNHVFDRDLVDTDLRSTFFRFDWPSAICYRLCAFMLLKPSQNLMRLGRLRRGMAIFLLAMAFFDMAIVDLFFPQFCGDDQVSLLGTVPIESTEKVADEFAATGNRDSQPVQDSRQSTTDEDCFCCCSHIIPSPHVSVATLNCTPQPVDPAIASLPSPPPRGPFHPPRLS